MRSTKQHTWLYISRKKVVPNATTNRKKRRKTLNEKISWFNKALKSIANKFFSHYIVFFHGHKYLEKRPKHCQQHYHVFSVVRKSEKKRKKWYKTATRTTNKQTNIKQNKQNCTCNLICIYLFVYPQST